MVTPDISEPLMTKSAPPLARRLREWRALLWLALTVKVWNIYEYGRTVLKYYPYFSFAKADLALLSQYVFKGPFRLSKQFLMECGEDDVHAYGETPLTTLEKIANEAGISPTDHIFELGCGRARTCLWLNKVAGCQVTGVDFVPAFIERVERVQNWLDIQRAEFRSEDILTTDLKGATVIYLYGTCYSPSFIQKLIERFRSLPAGTRIITVSYALSEYTSESLFEVMKVFPAMFAWGEGSVYVQVKK